MSNVGDLLCSSKASAATTQKSLKHSPPGLFVQSPRTQDILRIFRLASALCPSTELVIDAPETKYVYKVRKGFTGKMKKKTYCQIAESRCMFYSILLPGPYTPPSFGTTFPHFNRIPLLLPPSATPFSCTTQPHKHST